MCIRDRVEGARVYHAGTKKQEEAGREVWATAGGRVLAVVGGGKTREVAVTLAHEQAAKITFEGSQRRADIGIMHFEG